MGEEQETRYACQSMLLFYVGSQGFVNGGMTGGNGALGTSGFSGELIGGALRILHHLYLSYTLIKLCTSQVFCC